MKKMLPFNKALLIVTAIVAIAVSGGIWLTLNSSSSDPKSTAKSPTLTTDIAAVRGYPVAHVGGLMAYPIFLTRAEIHTWMEANSIRYYLEVGEMINVRYNMEELLGNEHRMYLVKPVHADSPDEVKRKLGN